MGNFVSIFVFQKGASSEKFFTYLVNDVLPVINQVAQSGEIGDSRLELLKVLVEVSSHVTGELAKGYIDTVFHKLIVSVPPS